MSATMTPHLTVEAPDRDSIEARYDGVDRAFEADGSLEGVLAAVALWDRLRRELHTWRSLVNLRFAQDTADPQAQAGRAALDALQPLILARDVAVGARLLAHPLRAELEARLGAQAFRLWEADAKTYAPQIEADLVRESELRAAYSALIGSATVEFRGRAMTLAEIRGYVNARDRDTRHSAELVRWAAYERRAHELDRLFDELVAVRDRIARALGYESFVPLAYARMQRVDYDAAAVARWRASVVRDVVPLARRIIEGCAARRGYARAMFWDEAALLDAETAPVVDAGTMLRELPAVLGDIDARLGDFATFMRDRELLDVLARPGKAPGGFCTSFPTAGYPYVFASFNGTKDDVKVLVHEMGHAFQAYSSNAQPLDDYLTPTFESAEINSMGLEFLAWPAMERYFGPNAEPFRLEHLAHSVIFLAYGCAVDHFQHLVYERPGATPAERHAMWQEMERLYLPWRDYGDLAYPARGAFWQFQLHIYQHPFYYVDYTLAMCCALQFWAQAASDRSGAIDRYIALAARGGSRSFTELVASAGLRSPLDGQALGEVVAAATERLKAGGLL